MDGNRLDVVFFKDGDVWVGQCLQYDLAAQGGNLKECMQELGAVILGRILAATEGIIEHPFVGLPPAPERYWQQYRDGVKLSAEASPLQQPEGIPPSFMLRPSDLEARVCC